MLSKMDIRYKGKWYSITPKPYEPERQTYKIAWMLVKNPDMTPAEAYRQFFETERQEAKVLYPSFRKDKDVSTN
jgi:hypothetical protein